MSSDWEWVIPVVIIVAVAIVISIIVIYLIDHPLTSGILIGLVAGIGGTVIGYRIRRWLQSHKIVEIKPSKK